MQVTKQEKTILGCLYRGMSDKSHRQETDHQLPNCQLAPA